MINRQRWFESYTFRKILEPLIRFIILAAITFGLIYFTVKFPAYLPFLAEGRYILLLIAGITTIATIKSYAQALDEEGHRVKVRSFIAHFVALLFGGGILLYSVFLMRSATSPEDSVTAQGILQVSLIMAAMTFIAAMKELIGSKDAHFKEFSYSTK